MYQVYIRTAMSVVVENNVKRLSNNCQEHNISKKNNVFLVVLNIRYILCMGNTSKLHHSNKIVLDNACITWKIKNIINIQESFVFWKKHRRNGTIIAPAFLTNLSWIWIILLNTIMMLNFKCVLDMFLSNTRCYISIETST